MPKFKKGDIIINKLNDSKAFVLGFYPEIKAWYCDYEAHYRLTDGLGSCTHNRTNYFSPTQHIVESLYELAG